MYFSYILFVEVEAFDIVRAKILDYPSHTSFFQNQKTYRDILEIKNHNFYFS